MKTFLDFLYEDDNEQWITTKSGKHILIDPDSGEIKSGGPKGTNIKNYVQNIVAKDSGTKKADDLLHGERVKMAFLKDISKQTSKLAKSYASKSSHDFSEIGSVGADAEIAYKELSKGLDGDKRKKFDADYKEAKSVFADKEAKKAMNTDVNKVKDEIKNLKRERDELKDDPQFADDVKELDADIKSAEDRIASCEKWKKKIEKAKETYASVIARYKEYDSNDKNFGK